MVDSSSSNAYRSEVLSKFFEFVRSGESFYLVGAPSVGKTRLVDYLLGDNKPEVNSTVPEDRHAVKRQYLGVAQASKTWLVRVDLNRIDQIHDWAFHFYELLLSSVLFECTRNPETNKNSEIDSFLAGLDARVIEGRDMILAHRFFEMAMNKLCQGYRINICFLFDEFDETYKKMPREIFSQLRAVRDANKYHLFYALFLRNLPEALRPPTENESFYELLSRNLIGIGPYSKSDTLQVLLDLELRKNFSLSTAQREIMYMLSGGHPGLINALFGIVKSSPKQYIAQADLTWYFNQADVKEEFRKIWNGLLDNERTSLLAYARDNSSQLPPQTLKILSAKGLLVPDGGKLVCFSPLFQRFLSSDGNL